MTSIVRGGMCACPECDREFTAIEQFGRFSNGTAGSNGAAGEPAVRGLDLR
jgi:hypothetical protein